jgi:hypothetical protein
MYTGEKILKVQTKKYFTGVEPQTTTTGYHDQIPIAGPAHFMNPLAFSMASSHGHFFRIGTAEKPYFPPLPRPM